MKQFLLNILYKITNPILVRINKEALEELNKIAEKLSNISESNITYYNEVLKLIWQIDYLTNLIKEKNKTINKLNANLRYYHKKNK